MWHLYSQISPTSSLFWHLSYAVFISGLLWNISVRFSLSASDILPLNSPLYSSFPLLFPPMHRDCYLKSTIYPELEPLRSTWNATFIFGTFKIPINCSTPGELGTQIATLANEWSPSRSFHFQFQHHQKLFDRISYLLDINWPK